MEIKIEKGAILLQLGWMGHRQFGPAMVTVHCHQPLLRRPKHTFE
jgi:hypothetical protein